MKKIRKVLIWGMIFCTLISSSFIIKNKVSASSKGTYMILTSDIKKFNKSNNVLIVKCTGDSPISCLYDDEWYTLDETELKIKLSNKVKWKYGSQKTTYKWIKKRIKFDYENGNIDTTGALFIEVKKDKVVEVMVHWEE